jgi:hypothetical protein
MLIGKIRNTSTISTVSENKCAKAGSSRIKKGMARQCTRQAEEINMLSLDKTD